MTRRRPCACCPRCRELSRSEQLAEAVRESVAATPRELLRAQLEESRRELESLPAWIRDTPPDFESAEARGRRRRDG